MPGSRHDALALASFTWRICYLEEDDCAAISATDAKVYNAGRLVQRPVKQSAPSGARIGKGNYPHFMLKEICEQPAAIGDTLRSYLNPLHRQIELPRLLFDFAAVFRLTIVAAARRALPGWSADTGPNN